MNDRVVPEGVMHELFPIVAGVMIALGLHALGPVRWRLAALIVLSVIFGVIAAVISGESATSWAFAAIDIAGVFIVAGLSVFLLSQWQERSNRAR